ncbi:nucleoside monophosphate kinase [Synoicihabitans lomoniglobus]|uniref:Adenylate kinase n=1 Tax=Synoicihabitans lomoniglobus TaxID=2909285 RepID=A0AAE9ZVS6_9BACT|nr:nucleoside monophosphate kinase [Opitutaceae bacterium LMO-M01]WED65022.1 nucleoside monophosphate kinase [Opitutaceae bacterium LMO-M01]
MSTDSASSSPATPQPGPPAAPAKHADLEIKDSTLIFNDVWLDLEVEYGRENLRFPKEIILLGGAPGSGKGTNTGFILQARGLTCPPVVVSSLLDTPEAQRIKDAGMMVGDREVIGILLRELLKPEYRDGCILDGFPRTKVQVESLKLLVTHMQGLRREFYNTPLGRFFRQPTVHIMVLFVEEKVSIERQLKRGRLTKEHNDEVRRTGDGELWEERPTDYDEGLARRRYHVFKEKTWDALQSLKSIFHYHFVNAQGSIKEVEANIVKELQYQSTLELDPATHDTLRHIPVASELIVHARQELVKRLDGYQFEHRELFTEVVGFVENKIMEIVSRHAISGSSHINTEAELLHHPLALAILIDVFSERGYHAVVDLHRIEVPEKVDLQTGHITCRVKKVFRITVKFNGSEIRRGN